SAEEQGGKGAGEQGSRGDFSPSPQSLCTEGGSLETYIDRVIAGYLREHRRVEALAARDETAWNELCKLLAGRAYNILLRLRVPAARAANEAPGFVQQTCEVVFSQPFPYDVSFDAWATLILRNQILQRYTRSQDLIDREPRMLSLDRPSQHQTGDDFSLYHLLADESGHSAFERVEVQEWLLQAIAQLRSRPQQQVIVDTFFYELSDDEIAGRLDRTRQAVYNLRHRALRRLKQILETRPFGGPQDIA
ncbi:MAG: RNA polymerase sigma factor, partial [Acidobacteriota bacterium]